MARGDREKRYVLRSQQKGNIYVIARGQGVPREGAKTKAQERFESVFSFLGRSMAAIVQSP